MLAVICELINNGYYSRFALTVDEFVKKYERYLARAEYPHEEGWSSIYFDRPDISMDYMLVDVHSKDWDEFFTDMYWGIPESDQPENDDNPAYIDLNECQSLWTDVVPYVMIQEFNKKGDAATVKAWDDYRKYLIDWAIEHNSPMYRGCMPVCYDEWKENEYVN